MKESLPFKPSVGVLKESIDQEDPIAFLISKLDQAPDDNKDPNNADAVRARRELLHSTVERLGEIGDELCRAFVETYKKHGFDIRGGVRFYIVGGRVQGKMLRAESDLDCAFTVLDQQDVVAPNYGEDDIELIRRKLVARKEFAFSVLDQVMREYGLLFSETSESGSVRNWTLLEPKVYGQSDEVFRSQGLPAVLVTEVRE